MTSRPAITDIRFHAAPGPTGVDLRPTLRCRKLRPKPDSCDYELQVSIRNVGTEMAPNYEAEVRFPKVLVTRELGVMCVGETETQTHRIYHVQEPFSISAGAQPVVLPILYFRAEPGPCGAAALEQHAEVTVNAPGMKGSRKDKKRIRDLTSS